MKRPPTHSPSSAKSSPALTVTLVAGIVVLLLLAFWTKRAFTAAEVAPDAKSEALDPASVDPAPAPKPRPGPTAPTPSGSDRPPAALQHAPAPATPADPTPEIPSTHPAPDRTPLAPPAPAATGGNESGLAPSGPETEAQRQGRIWLAGAKIGRFHRETGVDAQNAAQQQQTTERLFPGDSTGQLLWQMGYEWGYLVDSPPR